MRRLVIGLAAALMGLAWGGAARAADAWPSSVQATYKIHFSGLELGDFDFSSRVQQSTYSLASNAQISALFGAYEWKGQSRSTGAAAPTGPKPASYTFNFKNQSKTGNVQMSFAENAVSKVVAVPPHEKKPGTIELKDTHLKDVLDPLSAVMALTRSSTGRVGGINPCGRRLAIFDGKQRFDLIFSFKRSAPLSEIGSKMGRTAFVCRVRYVPIAGFRMTEEMRSMSQATGMEVWIVPLPEANLFVPYYVLIPVSAGSATLTANRIQIDTARGRIALTN